MILVLDLIVNLCFDWTPKGTGDGPFWVKLDLPVKVIPPPVIFYFQALHKMDVLQVANQQASGTYLKAVKRSHFTSSDKVWHSLPGKYSSRVDRGPT